MKRFLVILNMGKDYTIPLHMEAKDSIHAMTKAAAWCNTEGYFAIGMSVVVLHSELGIIEVK